MPLYEFLRLAIEKLESSQQTPRSIDLSSETENDLFDRVAENGQITAQKQPDAPRVCDDANLGNSVTSRIEKSGGVEYIFNDIAPALPSALLDFSRKDETVPWLGYPLDGCLQDYSSSVTSAKEMLAGNINSRQLLAKEPKELFLDGRTKKIALRKKASNSTRALDGDKTVEYIVTPSVSSGNSADERVSHHNTQRKLCEIEESECQSDKLQNESVGAKKSSPAPGGRGSKRSRAAEVHNLSERRRRDRINEKMRALQELIPNCNKADKASMLDEAIEYIKNLKHQVQIMSMGSGLCVPPLMFPPGTRHMYHAPIPYFPYMGVRMGINTSFENTNGGSPLCPVFPVLSIPEHPGPGAHLVPLTGWHQTSALRVPSHNEVPNTPSNKSV